MRSLEQITDASRRRRRRRRRLSSVIVRPVRKVRSGREKGFYFKGHRLAFRQPERCSSPESCSCCIISGWNLCPWFIVKYTNTIN